MTHSPPLRYGVLQRLPNKALIGDALPRGAGPHSLEEIDRQPHVDTRGLGCEFEANQPHSAQVVLRQIRFGNESFGLFVSPKTWKFLLQSM
jgi:hypothetical protein